MEIAVNIHYNGECKDALKLYEKAFKGNLTMCLHYSDADPSDMSIESLSNDEKMYVYHAEMIIANQRFFFSDSFDVIPKGQNISIAIILDCDKDVKDAYKILIDDGVIIHSMKETSYSSCFVSLVDKFGVRWEIMTENN